MNMPSVVVCYTQTGLLISFLVLLAANLSGTLKRIHSGVSIVIPVGTFAVAGPIQRVAWVYEAEILERNCLFVKASLLDVQVRIQARKLSFVFNTLIYFGYANFRHFCLVS
jgi:hypothetical protein